MTCEKCGKEIPDHELEQVYVREGIDLPFCPECLAIIKESVENFPKQPQSRKKKE
jgi:hypothetical protein